MEVCELDKFIMNPDETAVYWIETLAYNGECHSDFYYHIGTIETRGFWCYKYDDFMKGDYSKIIEFKNRDITQIQSYNFDIGIP